MTAEHELIRLARAVVDDFEQLAGIHLPIDKYNSAVRGVLHALSYSAREFGQPYIRGKRWCSKCQASYDPATACPHFAPYRQAERPDSTNLL